MNQDKLAGASGSCCCFAAVNSLNFSQGAIRVSGRHLCQNRIEHRVGPGRGAGIGIAKAVGVNRYGYTRNQPFPEFGSGNVGALNGIGAEIRMR